MKIFVVTPTFNEKKNIKELIEKINLANDKIDILVVDDNSPDGTHEIVNIGMHSSVGFTSSDAESNRNFAKRTIWPQI